MAGVGPAWRWGLLEVEPAGGEAYSSHPQLLPSLFPGWRELSIYSSTMALPHLVSPLEPADHELKPQAWGFVSQLWETKTAG